MIVLFVVVVYSFFSLVDLPPKRKIEKKREKVLNYELILQKNEFVQPVPSSTLKKSSKRKKEKACEDKSQALVTSKVYLIY